MQDINVKICPPGESLHYHYSKCDSVLFSVSKPVALFGVQHFGSESGEYMVVREGRIAQMIRLL